MDYLLGIDIGTSGTKTLITDVEGNIVASVVEEYPLDTPKPGWAEQDPAHWWRATVETTRRVIEKAGINAADIKGVGLSGQMHGSVFLDSSYEVIRPAILWCDQRTAEQCRWITEKVGKDVVVKTCQRIEDVYPCEILFIPASEEDNIKKHLSALDSTGVVTVGEVKGFTEMGGTINFVIGPKQTVRFEINTDGIDAAGVRVSSQLLNLAVPKYNR